MSNPEAVEILFEDANLLVINKPPGLLSQGEHRGDPNVVDWARAHVGRHYIGLVHRLDRNTSGLLVLAKRSKAAQRLTEQLQAGTLKRQYLAWLEGSLKQEQTWRHLLIKDPRTNRVRVANPSAPQGTRTEKRPQEAVLHVKPVARGRWTGVGGLELTLAEFSLETGRSHQIRVQAAAQQLPLVGDPKYGSGRTRDFGRPALHSCRLELAHPISGDPLFFDAPLPADMSAIARLE